MKPYLYSLERLGPLKYHTFIDNGQSMDIETMGGALKAAWLWVGDHKIHLDRAVAADMLRQARRIERKERKQP